MVGFAAETQNVLSYAADKMRRKKLNLVVANDISDTDIGFASDSNEVTVLGEYIEETLPRASKKVLAGRLISLIADNYTTWKTKQEHDDNP